MRLRDVFCMAMVLPTVSMAQSYRFSPAPYQLPPPPNNMSMTTPQRGYTSYNAQQAYAIVRSAAGAGVRNAAVGGAGASGGGGGGGSFVVFGATPLIIGGGVATVLNELREQARKRLSSHSVEFISILNADGALVCGCPARLRSLERRLSIAAGRPATVDRNSNRWTIRLASVGESRAGMSLQSILFALPPALAVRLSQGKFLGLEFNDP
jgi:hypothetical protein